MTSATSQLAPDLRPGAPPLLAVGSPGDPPGWAAAHRDELRALVTEHGALLVRGLGLRDAGAAAAVALRLADVLVPEREAFAPRTPVAEGLYSATPWPAPQQMCMHHELSYLREIPGLLAFACLTAPATGGATPVADAAAVLDVLPPALVERFAREGWQLVRSYNGEIGATVAQAFGTDDREGVEAYCRTHGIETAWQPDGTLHTRQRRPAVVRHPVSGRRCWVNQVAFLSEWTLEPEVREFLLDVYGADGLPFTTRYGDGEPLGADVVAEVNAAYDAVTVREPWQDGDLLLVDNIRTAHAREPFTGPREVVVALADPVRPLPEGGRP
jgi:alpha-ketoglutarate-dependent taurine dioxygenase